MTNNGEKLLSIRDLHLTMTSFDGSAHVLNGINLDVRRGEIWGLVGESGCGKSVTGLSISRLVASPPARYPQGRIEFEGRDMLTLPMREVQNLRGNKIGTAECECKVDGEVVSSAEVMFTVADGENN